MWVKGANYYEKVTFFWQNKKKAVSLHACLCTKILINAIGGLESGASLSQSCYSVSVSGGSSVSLSSYSGGNSGGGPGGGGGGHGGW